MRRYVICTALISIAFFTPCGFSLQQIFPEPVLRNPSFEDSCAPNKTGFFFAPDPSQFLGNGLNNISSLNAVSSMKWNFSGQGLQVVYGGASDGDCYLSPFWAGRTGGAIQTLSTAPYASYLVKFDMTVSTDVCGDSFVRARSIEMSAGGRNATKYLTDSGAAPWFSSTYQFKAESYQTDLSISGSDGTCGIGVDNVRLELVVEASSNVLSNGGFEVANGVLADPGSAGHQLQAGSKALSSWVVIGSGVTCFGPSFFPPTEGQRFVWLAAENTFAQDPGGLVQTLYTIVNTTYRVSFDVACQCNSKGSALLSYCRLKVMLDGDLGSLILTMAAQSHSARNPGWKGQVLEFTATSDYTNVTFLDATPSERINGVAYNGCPLYLDNVAVTIPAQQALLRLKAAFGSPRTLESWDNLSDPCLIPPSSDAVWAGVTCMGAEVTGLDLSGFGISQDIPFELYALYPSLQTLNLSRNSFSGSIPLFLARMEKLIVLDLSHNGLQGVIPAKLGNLPLRVLALQVNKLHGGIPKTLAIPTLKVLSLQSNNLSGSVPQEIFMRRYQDTILSLSPGNDGLCDSEHPSKSCNPSDPISPLNVKVLRIFLIMLGGGIAVLLIVGAIVLQVLKSRGFEKYKDSITQETIDLKLETCQALSFQELEEATQGFSVVLGRGGYGAVCKAHLKDGRLAAVKRLNNVSRQGPHEFVSEVELLSRLHHANLVSLLGYCMENREYILVYEFMPKGSLYDILHKPSARQPLAWKDRMKIAMQIAFGIEYLHYFATPGLVHRDIKSSNILLDQENNAKIADFGLSKESPKGADEAQTTAIRGSFGYLDPAYMKTSKLSSKSDVFSYGVILLELITGRRPIIEGELLTDWCKQFFDLDVILMMDPALARHFVEDELSIMASIARDCVIDNRELRPNMRLIVHRFSEGMSSIQTPSQPLLAAHRADTTLQFDDVEVDDDFSVLVPR